MSQDPDRRFPATPSRPIRQILYLHGFRSSPLSAKARTMASVVQSTHAGVTWWCPQLPASPGEAMALLLDGIAAWTKADMAVIGSSLGGFYATHIAEQTGCKAVLLNPAVHPARDLARQIGEHSLWHSPEEKIHFKPEYVTELQALEVSAITRPERYYTVIAKGDEVLDWREMAAHYPSSPGQLLEGSDHGLSDFNAQLPGVLAFLNLA